MNIEQVSPTRSLSPIVPAVTPVLTLSPGAAAPVVTPVSKPALTVAKLTDAASAVLSAAPVPGLQLGLFILREAIENEPAIAAEMQSLFSKGVPSDQDWYNLHASVANRTYRSYVPDSDLPPGEALD